MRDILNTPNAQEFLCASGYMLIFPKCILTLCYLAILILAFGTPHYCQTLLVEAENIRREYNIPELAYAIVSSDSVLEMKNLGMKRVNTIFTAESMDRFHLGSNTKAITGFVAALLVKQKKLDWDTKFFTLFPELKKKSNTAFYDLTLRELLTFRAPLPAYTYTNPLPKKRWFKGSYEHQRLQLARWFLRQKPQKQEGDLSLTNAGYILAGLMLERASGKSYKELVGDLGSQINANFGFDYPNLTDYAQTWGHDMNLKSLPPHADYKLNWLLSAGNVNANLSDYATFVQLQLKGLAGRSDLLTKEEFVFLHFGSPEFSVGWFWKTNENNHRVSFNTGNAGAFITEVFVIPEIDRAYILFANSASEKTMDGLKALSEKLMDKYGR